MIRDMDASRLRLAAQFDRLADLLADHGAGAEVVELVRLGRQARRAGAPLGLVDALVDPTSAPIARERAAVLLAAWLRHPRRDGIPTHPAARTEVLTAPSRVADQPVSC